MKYVRKEYDDYVKMISSESARIVYESLKFNASKDDDDIEKYGRKLQLVIFKHLLEKYQGQVFSGDDDA